MLLATAAPKTNQPVVIHCVGSRWSYGSSMWVAWECVYSYLPRSSPYIVPSSRAQDLHRFSDSETWPARETNQQPTNE